MLSRFVEQFAGAGGALHASVSAAMRMRGGAAVPTSAVRADEKPAGSAHCTRAGAAQTSAVTQPHPKLIFFMSSLPECSKVPWRHFRTFTLSAQTSNAVPQAENASPWAHHFRPSTLRLWP